MLIEMNWQLVKPPVFQPLEMDKPCSDVPNALITLRHSVSAMRRLDRFATESGYGWKKALMVAGELEGQTKGLNSGQVERVIREIKRRMKG